jgi:hypothetical protein
MTLEDEGNTHPFQPRQVYTRRMQGKHVLSMIQASIIIYGLLFALFLVVQLSVGERSPLIAFANNFLPWLCWIGIGLGVVGLPFRDRWLLVGLQLPAVFTFAIIYGGQLLPVTSQTPLGELTLTAVFYNVCG